MVDKVTLAPVTSFKNDTTAVTQTNANYVLIQNGLDNTVSRDGTQPNSMNANLDMNSNHILNLPAPSSQDEPLRLADVSAFSSGSAVFNTMPVGGTTGQVLSKNSPANYDTSWTSVGGTLPTGGSIGQALVKTSSTNYAANWFVNSPVNVLLYGADPTGVADSTSAIISAVAATPSGGTLMFPTGTYKVTNVINLTRPINIKGFGSGNGGPGTVFNCTLPGTSLFLVTTSAFTPNWQFKDFAIIGNNTGRVGIEFTGAGGWYEVQIDNLTISGMGLGYSIGATGATTAGFSYSTISNCNLTGGIYVGYGGDGLHIENNVITNPTQLAGTYCIYYNAVVGAAGLIIAKNVISGSGQLLSIDNAIGPLIMGNEFETIASSTATYACRIGGSDLATSTIGGNHGPTFRDNHVSIIAGGSNPIPLYFNNCSNATVKGGGFELPNPGAPVHVYIDTAASLTYVDVGNGTLYITNGVFNTPHISDHGTNTHLDVDFAGVQAPLSMTSSGSVYVNAPLMMCFLIPNINFNAANSDTAIPITLPASLTRYVISNIWISNASHSLTTATFGVFSAAGGGGATLIAPGTAITVAQTADNTLNNAQGFTVPNNTITAYDYPTIYFRVGTPEGAVATATVTVQILPIS